MTSIDHTENKEHKKLGDQMNIHPWSHIIPCVSYSIVHLKNENNQIGEMARWLRVVRRS